MGDIDLSKVDEATASKFYTSLGSVLTTTRSGRVVTPSSRYSADDYMTGGKGKLKGGHRCGKYFKFVLTVLFSSILLLGGGFIGALAIKAGGRISVEQAKALLATVNTFCSGNILAFSPFQVGVCGMILNLQKELVAFLTSQDFGTIKTAIAGAGVAVAGLGAWAQIKAVYTGARDLVDSMVEDFCNKFYGDRVMVDASVQTVADAAETAGPAAAPAGGEKATIPMDTVLKKGGAKKKRSATSKKRRTMKRSTRKLSFRY